MVMLIQHHVHPLHPSPWFLRDRSRVCPRRRLGAQKGRVKQKVVANLGRRDTLEVILPLLERFLRGDDQREQLARQLAQEGPIEVLDASTWGPMLVARHFFAELGLWQILDAGRRWPRLLPDENPDDDWPSRR